MATVFYFHSPWSRKLPLSSGNPCNCGDRSDDSNCRRSVIHGFVRDRIRRGEVEGDRCKEEEQQPEDIEGYGNRERKGIWTSQLAFVACYKPQETAC